VQPVRVEQPKRKEWSPWITAGAVLLSLLM
jgi:hypothetical protein